MTAEDIFEKRNDIIPVIGENCFFFYPEKGEPIPLQSYIVDKIIEKSNVKHPEDLPIETMKSKGFYGLSLCRQQCGFSRDEEFLKCYKQIINEAKGCIRLNKIVKSFLQCYKFHVIITTDCFDLIESELPWYTSKVYIAAVGANNKEELNEKDFVVYHVFGKSCTPSIWAWDEESLMYVLHCHHNNDTAPHGLQNYIYPVQDPNRKYKSLLILYSNLPDWLFRFFLYPLAYKDKWADSGFYLNSINRPEGSLKNFIEKVLCYDIEDDEVENVLTGLIDLLPTDTNSDVTRMLHNEKYDIFLSHTNEDKYLAQEIKLKLENVYGLHVWLDSKGGIDDGSYPERMKDGIDNSAYFMPLITDQYIGKLRNRVCHHNMTMEEILADDNKMAYVQKEALAAALRWEEIKKQTQRKAFLLPILFSRQGVNYNTIKQCVGPLGQLPASLFENQTIFNYEDMFEKDWSKYRTIEK